jgi:hypothetical protein
MPVHDWSPVEAGIFHHFHHSWIEEIQRTLNHGVLPPDYYALAEQRAPQLGPDVLTLQIDDPRGREGLEDSHGGNGGVMLAPPKKPFTAETDMAAYLRKQDRVAIRHVADDKVVAVSKSFRREIKAAEGRYESSSIKQPNSCTRTSTCSCWTCWLPVHSTRKGSMLRSGTT